MAVGRGVSGAQVPASEGFQAVDGLKMADPRVVE